MYSQIAYAAAVVLSLLFDQVSYQFNGSLPCPSMSSDQPDCIRFGGGSRVMAMPAKGERLGGAFYQLNAFGRLIRWRVWSDLPMLDGSGAYIVVETLPAW